MNSDERKAWVATLKPGDIIGVYDLRGTRLIHTCKVARVTPSGRIVSDSGATFRADGYLHISRESCYAERVIAPVAQTKA